MAKLNKKKNSKKLWYWLGGLLVVLIFVAIIGKKQGFIGGGKATEVVTDVAKRTTIVEKVSASGTVQPQIEIKLSPDVAGEIIELNVKEGDSVAFGDLLVKIRPDNLESALERTKASLNTQKANLANARASLSKAEASFTRAELEYKRQKGLYDKKVISQADWELAESNYIAAENDLKSAKENVRASEFIVASSQASVSEAAENLRLTNVYAPSSGTVSKLSVEKGERVVGSNMMSGTELLRIADLSKMEVRVDVNENDIIRVSLGDTAIIEVDSYSHMDTEFKGVVTSIANTANDKISSDAVTEFEVKIQILNSSFQDLLTDLNITTPFRPGMTASVDIITERRENILSVPLSAVTTRKPSDLEESKGRNTEDDGEEEEDDEDDNDNDNTSLGSEEELIEVVFVVEDGKAQLVPVKTGISDFDNIEILEGIEEGKEVVSGPFLQVSKRLNNGENIISKDSGKKDKEEESEKEED